MEFPPHKPGVYKQTLESREQRYALYIPDCYASGRSHPLVLVLHWGGPMYPFKGMATLEKVVLPAFRELDALMVAPDCTAGHWANPQSEAAVLELLDHLLDHDRVDRDRILLTGISRGGTVIWLLYVLGVMVAILVGMVFSRTLLKPDESTAFVLELPPYRTPALKGLLIHTWENTREFVHKAGTVILAISMILWLLLNLPWGVTNQRASYYGQVSAAIAPALEPAGFGEWEPAGALITGFIAKELVVSTLTQIYTGMDDDGARVSMTLGREVGAIIVGFGQATINAGRTLLSLLPGVDLLPGEATAEDTTLSRALQAHFSPLAAVAFLVFVLLYIPCMATVGAIKQEFGWRWAASSAVYQTVMAWVAAILVYQGGRFLGLG